jgi:hypothetical protein
VMIMLFWLCCDDGVWERWWWEKLIKTKNAGSNSLGKLVAGALGNW